MNWRMSFYTVAIAANKRRAESAKQKPKRPHSSFCHAIGLETGSAAADYIQLWNGDKETLTNSLTYIQKAASQMLAALTDS
jgi:hypothetical protein